MNYYQEVTLLPDAEIALGFIWKNVFQQVHIALVENKIAPNQSAIAVGFPDYKQTNFPLGSKLRLFAKDKAELEQLGISEWLTRLEDYVHVKAIKPVPADVTYVCFKRTHVKSAERIDRDMQEKAKRWAAKSGQSLAQCLLELEKTKPVGHSKLPFIFLHSQETKRRSPHKNSKFPLFISKVEVNGSENGTFDSYGLSAKSNGENNFGCVPQF
ncbi:type I-F CRISPR-associated endoribonuclease Cas6/Csy4 [Pseudoalteromonas sp. CuT4-3]|uniref:type I-F CRISPR-associated endoribonuclease Cas6/Csy4 n=1 Tax=Pseudoalteromonas sp. CuT4-3 TaxID=3112573 RepID=UPI002D785BC8|nr:type I-F CRISPR-associated endoribonuclease Cas6/Csy4 [Pseudoalteromonas sp. CuT 4-3]WRU72106.1 type I-F CRISPR-associated endoribonuclease Cas6/Csy4 [Pseudoalteromonas sp. CuT 4-3]